MDDLSRRGFLKAGATTAAGLGLMMTAPRETDARTLRVVA
ncbi:MAG: twin-arginine translocation signal domain-containing protein, partial [Candidatus Rokubacteria bacterium]|nr:twin-arginine translocation signal domain-containing protein [Candidatus Rokubacteria bacterium]